jgi:hypothetical protein
MPRGVCDVDFTLPPKEEGIFGLGQTDAETTVLSA